MSVPTRFDNSRKRKRLASELTGDVADGRELTNTEDAPNPEVAVPDDFETFAQEVRTRFNNLSQQVSNLHKFAEAGFQKFAISSVHTILPRAPALDAHFGVYSSSISSSAGYTLQDNATHSRNIISNAPWESLFVLRKVSRAIRDLADAALVRQINIEPDNVLVCTGSLRKRVRIPRSDWNRAPALAAIPRIVNLRGILPSEAYEERVRDTLQALSHVKVIDYAPVFSLQPNRAPDIACRLLIVRVLDSSDTPVLDAARAETIYFKCRYRELSTYLSFGTRLNCPSLKTVYFHFEAHKWYLPNHEHHPLTSPRNGPRLVDSIIQLTVSLVRRKVTVYFVEPKSWHPSWMMPTGHHNNSSIDMESRIVTAITRHGGHEYVKVLTKAQVKEHFDAETYGIIEKTRRDF